MGTPRRPWPDTKAIILTIHGEDDKILGLVVAGHNMNAIGERLSISYHTVNNHVRNIYRKLHVRSRASVVAKALREDLVQGGPGAPEPPSETDTGE